MIVDEYFFMAFIQVNMRYDNFPSLTGFLLKRLAIFIQESMRKVRFIFVEKSDRSGRILLLRVYQIVLKVAGCL